MNRTARRALASKGPSPEQAYVHHVVEQAINQAGQQILQQQAQSLLQALAPLQVRLTMLEGLAMEKLGETRESLAARVIDVEDSATGYRKSEEAARPGDLVRLTAQVRIGADGKFANPISIAVRDLTRPAANGKIQTYEALEQGIVGMMTLETKDIDVDVPVNEKTTVKYTFRVTIDRISAKIAPPPAQPVETPAEASVSQEGAPQ